MSGRGPQRDQGSDGGGRRRGAPRKVLPLRLSPELHEELRRWADQEMRSLNAHLEYLLREAVRRHRGGSGGRG